MLDVEKVLSAPQGAVFRRCDLHVHTPVSVDMHEKWREATPDNLVQLALQKGLEVIGITDHNSVSWCDSVRKAAVGSPLIVLPGVEISTREGHLVGLFDPEKPSSEVKEFLIQIGIREKDFGNLHAICSGGIDEVARAVETEGGLAIAAHVDRDRGFLQMVKSGARRKQIRACKSLRAMEIVDPATREKLMAEPAAVGCLQSSDSWPAGGDQHHLDAIGTRHCYIKMDQVSVWALRQATMDPQLRIRLSEEARPRPDLSIEGVYVSGGFLQGQEFRLGDDISCLIGDTGAGKSLTLELIRFALDQGVSDVLPGIREDVDRLLRFALSDMDTVYVLIRKGEERYVVERPWLGANAPPPVVHRIVNGQPELITDPVYLPSFFQIKGYSQGEIIEYAREPLARLSLIDGLIDTETETDAIATAKAELRNNASEIIQAQKALARDQDRLKQLPGIDEEIAALSKFLEHPEVQAQEIWQEENAIIETWEDALAEVSDAVRTDFPALSVALPTNEEVPNEPVNPDLLNRVESLADGVRAELEKAQGLLSSEMEAFQFRLSEIRAVWERRFGEAQERYRKLAGELDQVAQGQAALLARLSQRRDREKELKRIQRRVNDKLVPLIQGLQDEREKALTRLQDARKALTEKRRKKADQLGNQLAEKVSIEVKHAADSREFQKALSQIRTGSRLQESEIEAMARTLHPIRLVKSILQGKVDESAKTAGIQAASLERLSQVVIDRDRLEELYELQLVDLEDLIKIRFAVSENTYRDLEALAHGQKCTVVLMISLAEGAFPLLVDQPEDALHAPWIEGYIVTALRRHRGRRQCIFATRNANVLVSSDAEQVIALTADAVNGEVHKTGALDRFDTRDLVLFHVEGGRDAFKRRQDKYGLDFVEA